MSQHTHPAQKHTHETWEKSKSERVRESKWVERKRKEGTKIEKRENVCGREEGRGMRMVSNQWKRRQKIGEKVEIKDAVPCVDLLLQRQV